MNEMYHIAADRQKSRYGYVSNFAYYLKTMREWDKWMFYSQVLIALPMVAAYYLSTLLPAKLVEGLEKQGTMADVMLPLLAIALAIMLCNMVKSTMENYTYEQWDFFPLHYMKMYVSKIMDVDYEKLEDKDFKPLMENAWASGRFGKGISNAIGTIPELMGSGTGVCLFGVIMGRQSVLILVLMILSVGVNLYLLSVARKMHQKYYGRISKYAKGEEYITAQCMDSAAGKDIRIYQMMDFILKKYDENLEQMGNLYGKIHNWYCFRNVSGAVLEFARDAVAYGLLVYELVCGRLTAADFVFLLGVISSFSNFFEIFLRQLMGLNSINTSITYIRDFMATESAWKKEDSIGREKLASFREKPVKLELREVSFTYPGNSEPTIKKLNLVIDPGEKLALIGLNGAGKTTLVKLICGLYQPDEGEILLNDIPVREYTRESYFSLISVLFQDVTLLPVTVDENIICGEARDGKRLQKVLELSGFAEKYESLPEKGNTQLIKKIEESAVDFSGGEKQKLLFARALYQQAPLVILDEPTAALDPIAENELYVHFGKAMENRTSIYISHRLSSTRFCDRIILLEHGQIIEEGTHEGLLAEEGRYAKLFEMQSKYYREQEEQKKRSALMGDAYVETETGGIFHE